MRLDSEQVRSTAVALSDAVAFAAIDCELRAFGVKLAWSTITIGCRGGLCRLVPQQGMASRRRTGVKGKTCPGHPERQLPLAAAHAVGADREFGRGQPKASVHQVPALFL